MQTQTILKPIGSAPSNTYWKRTVLAISRIQIPYSEEQLFKKRQHSLPPAISVLPLCGHSYRAPTAVNDAGTDTAFITSAEMAHTL